MLQSRRLGRHPELQRASVARPSLSRGAKGAHVAEIQDFLVDLGQQMPRSRKPQGFDGIFGPETEAAVKAFQLKVRLRPDGIVGPKTLAALDSIIARRPDLDVISDTHKAAETAFDVQRINRRTFWEG